MIWHSKLHWFPVHSMGQDFWVSVQKAAHSFTCRLYKSKDHYQHKTFIQLNNVLPGISFIHFTSTQSLKSTSMFKPNCKKKNPQNKQRNKSSSVLKNGSQAQNKGVTQTCPHSAICTQYLLCLGLKMVLGSLSLSLSLSRSRWLLGDERSCVDFSLLKRSRPVLRICSSSFWWRFISESTLSSWAVRFTVERAEEPEKSKARYDSSSPNHTLT